MFEFLVPLLLLLVWVLYLQFLVLKLMTYFHLPIF
jgi:hypothetical protein